VEFGFKVVPQDSKINFFVAKGKVFEKNLQLKVVNIEYAVFQSKGKLILLLYQKQDKKVLLRFQLLAEIPFSSKFHKKNLTQDQITKKWNLILKYQYLRCNNDRD